MEISQYYFNEFILKKGKIIFEDSDVRQEAIWVFNAAGLTCLTCPEKKGERRDWDSFDSEKTRLDSLNKMKSDSLSKAKFEGKSAPQD